MSAEKPLRVFLIAGEASGDRLGAALVRGLRAELAARGDAGPLEVAGVGGAAMAAEGVPSLFDIRDIAVMGLTEVIPKLPVILKRLGETAEAAIALAPDILVSIDAPDFGLRVARRARARLGRETVLAHYVAPSVWAWRPGRAAKLAERIDHLMALLPFEPPYFEEVGLSCDFVGHPIVESAAVGLAGDRTLRGELGIADAAPLVVALPGSRAGEIRRLAPVFGETLGLLKARRPDLEVVVPLAENVADLALAAVADWPVPAHALDPRGRPFETAERRKFLAMAASDAALAASGTVSLELAAVGAPMAIAYRVSTLSAMIARRLLKIETATLVNLVTDTRAVPEFLQENCTAEFLVEELDALLEPTNKNRLAQLAAGQETMRRLGAGGEAPGRRAARSLLTAHARARSSAG